MNKIVFLSCCGFYDELYFRNQVDEIGGYFTCSSF